MNIQQVKDQLNKAAMDAMNNGGYVTILFYNWDWYKQDTYISGKTFKNCVFQGEYNLR